LDVFVADSPALRMRLAVVVPKHGRKIVERNRLKRRLRESARLELLAHCLDRGAAIDILIRARPPAYEAGFQQLRDEIRELAEVLCSQSSS
jgi:ribonuclease P protein component